jgi:AbrB family looped-hinge helix DNA binding protein
VAGHDRVLPRLDRRSASRARPVEQLGDPLAFPHLPEPRLWQDSIVSLLARSHTILEKSVVSELAIVFARVQSRGQVTLPRDVRRRAGIDPGDTLLVLPDGPGRVRLEVVRHMPLEETFARWKIDGPVDLVADREAIHDDLAGAVLKAMPRDGRDSALPARG